MSIRANNSSVKGRRLREAQFAQLMDGLAAPLNQRANAPVFQMLLQTVAALGFDFVVLVNVEVIVIAVGRGRKG